MAKLSSSSSSSNSHHLGHLPLWLISALRAAKMEGKASGLLKQVASFVKAKLAAVKGKTSAVKTQLVIFGLLHNRKALMTALSDKIHTLMSSHPQKLQEAGAAASDHVGKIMISQRNAPPTEARCEICTVESVSSTGREIISVDEDEEDVGHCTPDHLIMIGHSLSFDDEVRGGGGGTESVNDGVKKYTGRDGQGEFVLEEEIDQVAELFIERFRRQMMLERLESFRRRQEGSA